MKINKTIIPAAGIGTRFLPLTKTLCKEMLPLLNKPAIQYIVEESIQAGINQLVMITNKDRDALMNYFDKDEHLDSILKERGKTDLTKSLDAIIDKAKFTYIRQNEPRGLGHAILMAESIIDPEEYIGIMLPDDIIINKTSGISQLLSIARQEHASIIAVQEVPQEQISSYGVIAIKQQLSDRLFQVSNLVEKPQANEAPSNLAIIGRYVLSGKIIESLHVTKPSQAGELQLTDAISHMMHNNEKLFAYKIEGTRFDTGTPFGWLKAMVTLALQDPVYGQQLKDFLSSIDKNN